MDSTEPVKRILTQSYSLGNFGDLEFRGLGFRVQAFRVQGFRHLGVLKFRGLGCVGFSVFGAQRLRCLGYRTKLKVVCNSMASGDLGTSCCIV